MESDTELLSPHTKRIELAGRHQLVVQRSHDSSILRLLGRNGEVCLSIEVTQAGPVLLFDGAALKLEASGDLTIEAERLAFVGRSEVTFDSGGDLQIHAERDLHSKARIQNITADLGNVNVKANDDVRINGERVCVNCDEVERNVMELENHTPFHAFLFRGCIDEERLFGSLVVRLTYDLRGDQLFLADEQSWPVSPGPWMSPYGPMESDELFYRGGVDLFVFGSARAADGKPAASVDVTVQAGEDFSTTVRVFGERHWEKQGDRLIMTQPQPFEAMSLTIANAYGGKDEWDELPVPFPGNPEGKGYVMSAESAPAKPLPNIEDPDHLIQSWEDQPEPVGVCPCPFGCGPRFVGRVVFDEVTDELRELKPTFYNHAFPRMIAPFLKPGDPVRVTGVRPGGPIEFSLPEPAASVRVSVGQHGDQSPPPIDQIGIDVDREQVFLTYRYSFRYVMVPLERRSCELLPANGANMQGEPR